MGKTSHRIQPVWNFFVIFHKIEKFDDLGGGVETEKSQYWENDKKKKWYFEKKLEPIVIFLNVLNGISYLKLMSHYFKRLQKINQNWTYGIYIRKNHSSE